MTYTPPEALRDKEFSKFSNDITGSAVIVNIALYGLSGANWLPTKCLSDGTLLTSGA